MRERNRDTAAFKPIVLRLAAVRFPSHSLTTAFIWRHAVSEPERSFFSTESWKEKLTAALSHPTLNCSWLATLATGRDTQLEKAGSTGRGVLACAVHFLDRL